MGVNEKIDDNPTRICKACGREKPLKSFYRNKYLQDGYELRCKICKNNGVTFREKGIIHKPSVLAGLKLTAPSREHYRDMYLFLQSIGYSLERNIHEQFCEKYNLEPKKRRKVQKNKYGPDILT